MKLRIVSLLIISLVTAGLTVTAGGQASAAPAPDGAEAYDAWFPSEDGTMLHAEFLLPEGTDMESGTGGCFDVVNPGNETTGCPVIVSMGPYFGSGVQNGVALGFGDITNDAVFSNRFYDFSTYLFDTDEDGVGDSNVFEMGYAWVQVDSRGYGESGGCNDYGGHGEQQDMAAAVTWAGTQSWSNGKVGTWGKSYDAWTQVMGLAQNPPHLEAAIIQAPIIDGYGIAYVNGVHHDSGWYVTTDLYALYDYSPNSIAAITSNPTQQVHPLLGIAGVNPNNNGVDTPACWVQQNVEVLNPDRDWYFWQERDLRPRASRNDDVAVFYTHGFTDVNTKPDQVFGVYDGLTANNGDQTRAWFGQWNHVRGSDARTGEDDTTPHDDWVVGRAGWNEEALDWLNHYLRGEDFAYEVNAMNVVEAQDNEGMWRTEATYPSSDVVYRDMPIAPGTYDDQLSTDGYWSVTPEVDEAFRITGESVVSIDVEFDIPNAQFVGVLYDITPSGMAEEIGRSMYRFPESGTYEFTTHPGDWIVREGHRLGFEIKSAHPESFPYPTLQTVTVTGGTVSIPVPTYERETNLGGTTTSARSLMRDQFDPTTATEVDMDMAALEPIAFPDPTDPANPPAHPQGLTWDGSAWVTPGAPVE